MIPAKCQGRDADPDPPTNRASVADQGLISFQLLCYNPRQAPPAIIPNLKQLIVENRELDENSIGQLRKDP